MSLLAEALENYPPATIAAHNAFILDALTCRFQIGASQIEVSDIKPITALEADHVLCVTVAHTTVELAVRSDDLALLLNELLPDVPEDDLGHLPQDWLVYLGTDAFCTQVFDLPAEDMSVTGLAQADSFRRQALACFTVTQGSRTIELPFRVKAHGTPRAGVSGDMGRLARFPLTVRTTLPAQTLSLAALDDLECGDVILLPSDFAEGLPAMLTVGHRCIARCSLNDRTLSIMEPDDHPEDVADTELQEPIDTLSDLDVRLDFVLHSQVQTLADISALHPGQVLTLDADADLELRIVSSGRQIGTGTLISVGEHLGVQITSWIGKRGDD